MTPHTRPETTPAPDVVVPTSDLTPAEAWEVLAEGNRRFVAGEPSHPNQNAER
ncbi:MAG: carbonic anhydrase, partial [Micrococcus luteus]